MSLYPNDILDSRSTTSPLICFSYPSYSLQPPSRILQHRVHFLQVQGSQSTFLRVQWVLGIEYISYRYRGIGYISYRYQSQRIHFLQVQGSQSIFLTCTGVIEYIFNRYKGHRVHFLEVQGSQVTFFTGIGVKKFISYRYRGQKVPFLQIYFGAYIEYISFKYTCHRKHSKVNYFIYLFIFSSPTIQSGVPLAKNRYGTAIINQTTRYIR